MRKKPIGTVYALCFFFLSAGCFFAAGMMQVNGSYIYSLFQKHAMPHVQNRFSADEIRRIADGLNAFLRNGDPSVLIIGTDANPVFSEKEMLHLTDCALLFSRVRTLKNCCLLVPALVLISVQLSRNIRQSSSLIMLRRGLRIGAAGFLFCLAALLVYAAVDFERFFIFFHRALFSNELWLMNAQRDLLVQIMPLSFFSEYAERILVYGVAAVIGAEFVLEIIFWLLMKRSAKSDKTSFVKNSGVL